MPHGTRRPRPPVSLTQRGAERRLAQEMAAGRITRQQFLGGVGALSKATVGAGQTTVTAGALGLPDPFAAALQQRPAQFREAALTGRQRIRKQQAAFREQFLPRGTSRSQFEAQSRIQQQQELRGQPGVSRAAAEAQRRVGAKTVAPGMTRAQAQAQERMGLF
jgi:hypothetical protein